MGGGGTVPVEVGFDSLLDQPQGVVGLVVQVAADLVQDLGRDVGKVVTLVGSAQNLHGGLADGGSQSWVGGVEEAPAALQGCHTVQVRRKGRSLQEGAEAEESTGKPHDG